MFSVTMLASTMLGLIAVDSQADAPRINCDQVTRSTTIEHSLASQVRHFRLSQSAKQRAEELFLLAMDVAVDELPAFLDQHCGDDEDVRRELEALLQADAAAGGDDFLRSAFLGKPSQEEATSPTSVPDSIDQSTHASRFEVLSRYEEGGLGEVLIAYDRQLRREVAIKQIKPRWQSNEEARQRFVQEAEVTGKLEHPGVVPVYAMGTWDDGRDYYAMRFIEGDTLGEVIDRYHEARKRDDPDQRRELRNLLNRFVDVCNTIDYAHSKNVLHRDIKPSNIMVGPYGETLVLDWGLAKLLDVAVDESMTSELLGDLRDRASGSGSTPTQVGGRVGTPQYMSPEQASGELDEIGIRTDIYLLGATLYQILTGQPPHQEESISRLLANVSSGILTLPREVDSNVPRALEAICCKAMQTDAVDRYGSAALLAADVEGWLADAPIAVHKDSMTVRFTRWVRRHRTAAASVAVAAVLLTVGSVAGSLFWDIQRTKQLKLEGEKQQQELQLRTEREQRVIELKAMVNASTELAKTELQAGRYSSALGFLRNATSSIRDEAELQDEFSQLQSKADRLQRIVSFYQHADIHERLNVMSRDTKAMTACISGLKSLDIFDKDDWWFRLPDEDLSAAQRDQLRWDVYQQLMLLDAMLTKTIGVRLIGTEKIASRSGLIRGARRFLGTDAGKREAAAVLVVSDRLDGFRLAEASRWYRSMAEFRYGRARRIGGDQLEMTKNASDAQCLGVLSMIAAIDPNFELFFSGYQGDDSMVAAHDLFNRSASLRPDHYWTHLSLAQIEFLMAMRKESHTWRDLEIAVQAIGRCISINPEKCFAFADRSTVFREQARLIEKDESLSIEERNLRASELRQWSLADAQQAARLGVDQPRMAWQYALALYEVGQADEAFKQVMIASKLTFPLIDIQDAAFLLVDDLRGRQEVGDIIEEQAKLSEDDSDQANLWMLLATIRLNQNRFDESLAAAEAAIKQPDAPAHAWAVRGMILMQQKKFDLAARDFERVIESEPNHEWAVFGLAKCDEESGQFDTALAGYRRAELAAQVDEHRAAGMLGQSRVLGLTAKYDKAKKAIYQARELEPACDVLTVVRPLVAKYNQLKDKDAVQADALKSFIQQLSKLPRVTKIEFPGERSLNGRYRAAVLNGDFELSTAKYWSDTTGAGWICNEGNESTATVTNIEKHSGKQSLHIRGDSKGFARTGQTFPVAAGRECKVSLWARGRNLKADSVVIQTGDGEPVITLPSGSFGWQQLEGSFRASGETAFSPVRLEILSQGPGQAWLDDLQVLVESKTSKTP